MTLLLLGCITSATSHASDFERSAGPFDDCGTITFGACGEEPSGDVQCLRDAIDGCTPSKAELVYSTHLEYLFVLEDCGSVQITEVNRTDCDPGELYYDDACEVFVVKDDFCVDIPLD